MEPRNTYRTFCGPGSILPSPRLTAGKAAPASTLETRSSFAFIHGRVSSIALPGITLIARASTCAHSPEPSKTRLHCSFLLLKGYARIVGLNLICSWLCACGLYQWKASARALSQCSVIFLKGYARFVCLNLSCSAGLQHIHTGHNQCLGACDSEPNGHSAGAICHYAPVPVHMSAIKL